MTTKWLWDSSNVVSVRLSWYTLVDNAALAVRRCEPSDAILILPPKIDTSITHELVQGQNGYNPTQFIPCQEHARKHGPGVGVIIISVAWIMSEPDHMLSLPWLHSSRRGHCEVWKLDTGLSRATNQGRKQLLERTMAYPVLHGYCAPFFIQ